MRTQIRWRDQSIPVVFSKRKTMSLHVKSGAIELRAPHHLPLPVAEAFIQERTFWLEKILSQHEEKKSEIVDYSQRNHIPFMGLRIRVHRNQASQNKWNLVEEGLQCSLQDTNAREPFVALLNDFYERQAAFWLTKKTKELAQRLMLDSKLKDIRLRRTKTKWGHCTHDGHIQFNWQIMMAPENIIDYLVSHEVCHLKHLNHSPAFWKEVEKAHPTYKADRQWLKDNGHRLVMS